MIDGSAACGDDKAIGQVPFGAASKVKMDGYYKEMTRKAKSEGRVGEIVEALQEDAVPPRQTYIGDMGNVYIRPMSFAEVGSSVHGHAHNFDHVTMVSSGAVHLRAFLDNGNGEPAGEIIERTFKAPAFILIKKEMNHEFTALEPGTQAHCIFALRNDHGEVAEHFDGNMFPYGSKEIGIEV